MPDQTARVLVVDSEPKVLATVSTLLRQEGHQVETADRLQSVLRDQAGAGPDVLLTELTAGELDLLSAVRAAGRPRSACC